MSLDRGKFEVTVFKDNSATDTRQVPAGGVSVAIFQEGATVKTEANILSGSEVNVTVYDVGDLLLNDTIQLGTDATKAGSVSSAPTFTDTNTATVPITGTSAFTAAAGTRLVKTSDKPSLQQDDVVGGGRAAGASGVLTADSTTGYVSAFIKEESVDYIVSGTGVTTTLFIDIPINRPTVQRSNTFDEATAIAFQVFTETPLTVSGARLFVLKNSGDQFYVDIDGDVWTASGVFVSDAADGASADAFVFDADNAFTTGGAKLASFTNNSTEKFFIDKDGGFTAAQASTITAGGLTVTAGGLTITAGGLTVTDGDIKNDTGIITSSVADGSAVIAHKFDVDNTYSTANALLADFQNNGTSKLFIGQDGHMTADGTILSAEFIGTTSAEAVTISGGIVTITRGSISVTVQTGSTDDLDTITPNAAIGPGDGFLIVKAASSVATVVMKDGTGNLILAGDFSLTHTSDRMLLVFDGANWVELSRSDNDT